MQWNEIITLHREAHGYEAINEEEKHSMDTGLLLSASEM